MQEMQETRVRSLVQEHALKKGMVTPSVILPGRIPWTEEPGGLQSMGHKESDMTKQMHACTHTQKVVVTRRGFVKRGGLK